MVLEALKLFVAFYLLLIAFLAILNLHAGLFSYPFRVVYSFFRLLIMVLTFGRVKITPLAKRAKRTSSRRARNIKFLFEEWRRSQKEEKALQRGEVLQNTENWGGGRAASVSNPLMEALQNPETIPEPVPEEERKPLTYSDKIEEEFKTTTLPQLQLPELPSENKEGADKKQEEFDEEPPRFE